jgi:hypothetical protein
VLLAVVAEASQIRPTIIENLENQGFAYGKDTEIEGIPLTFYIKMESYTLVCLHDAAKIGDSAAGSINITLVDGKPFWTFHIAAPTLDTVRSEALRMLKEAPKELPQLLSHSLAAKEGTHQHESTHIACMASGSPWGRIMFTDLLNKELDRCIQARDAAGDTSNVTVTLAAWQKELYIDEGVSETQASAALLISELRAHLQNFPTSPERASSALQVFGVIENCLKIYGDPENPSRHLVPARVEEVLASWQKYICACGYSQLAGEGVVQEASKLLLEHGTLRTELDPKVIPQAEAWIATISPKNALGI